MRKKVKIKHAEEFNEMHTRSLILDDPGAAAAYAAQEAFSAGVTPSAVMYSSPGGAATGDDLVASESTPEPEAVSEELANSAPEEPEAPEVVEDDGEKAESPKLDKAVKPALNKSVKDSAPAED
jgi:hypothetical protein